MAHIPPKRELIDPIHTPITIKGGAKTITINLPLFFEVNTSMSIKLSSQGGEASLHSTAIGATPGHGHDHEDDHDHDPEAQVDPEKRFRSEITSIELEGVQQVEQGVLTFKPKSNGECTIRIFFKHPEQP